MKRRIYKKLQEWKNTSNGKTALLIDGARRVGKSYIAEAFAKNEYASYAIVGLPRVRHHWWTKSGGVAIGTSVTGGNVRLQLKVVF